MPPLFPTGPSPLSSLPSRPLRAPSVPPPRTRSRRLHDPLPPTSPLLHPQVMPPKNKPCDILQNIIDASFPAIRLQDDVPESSLTKEVINDFLKDSPTPRFVGVAPVYSEKGSLCRLALAVSGKVIIVQFAAKGKGSKAYAGREFLDSELLHNPDVTIVGFDFYKVAVVLFTDQSLRVLNGVDLNSACGKQSNDALGTIQSAIRDRSPVMEVNVNPLFSSNTFDAKRITNIAIQAWLAYTLSTYDTMEEMLRSAPHINTKDMNDVELQCLADLDRGEQRLQLVQGTSVRHDFSAAGSRGETAHLRADRFQTRFQKETASALPITQRVMAHDHETGLDIVIPGQVSSIIGRNTIIKTTTNLENRTILSVTTHGPVQPTNAERERAYMIRSALQGQTDALSSPFLQYIMRPSETFTWPDTFPTSDVIPDIVSKRSLNHSQECAVQQMLADMDSARLTIIKGPPGTGKTTVIAAFVASAVSAGQNGIWLVAESNFAVKNIAEKLADVGFWNFRLLISKEFHFGWHDHLYKQIQKNVISSIEFKQARSRIQGVPVMLCTLSMLSNKLLHIFTNVNPVKALVIDEASQITLGSYVFPFNRFATTIHKIAMIGDDKQLPPYGADNDPDTIKSIFEVEHLHPHILFLAIQYRMPSLIGEVVSDVNYDGQLDSWTDHPVPPSQPCCWFVHVDESQESKWDTSWQNVKERAAVIKIAAKLQAEEKNFCIITPYDAQRTLLVTDLKAAGLQHEDKCFNVDSFQGNERDYVIVSIRGMYIVTSWDFVEKKASHTLVGRMSAAWSEDAWILPDHLTVENVDQ
ncbi:P-loop containing nucleoside triphosphate hydrolase protein [Epithele typhae]|uniref:P-loop containing nucleoside triphosphate hydrolase protein n=1 Tax=Epithele typhae TaxID=378194 RepID=UPI0020085765|nr:P-loop containing nucleoside triphosphate hydrolase protein [Epithele typhae]KAH9945186.1 P-loop containing nucleoside triphosphate hydrolase protein [Epithele typhae]